MISTFHDIDSDIFIFFSGDMDHNTIDLNNVNFDDDNFDDNSCQTYGLI